LRRASRDSHCTKAAFRVDVTLRFVTNLIARDIGKYHDRKLETLGTMHGHKSNALGTFFNQRRLGQGSGVCISFELVNETAK